MLWVVLYILTLIHVSGCVQNVAPAPSVPDAIRFGASVVSTFLNSKSPQALFSVFNKLTKEIKVSENHESDVIMIVLRLLGIDRQKVTNFALGGLISVVQLMSQIFLNNDGRKRKKRAGFSLLRFVLSQPKINHLISLMQDPDLSSLILKESKEKLKNYPEEKVDCIKALICRMKPFVQEMQRSLKFFVKRDNIDISGTDTCSRRTDEENCMKKDEETWEEAVLEDRMYFFVPSLKEVVQWGDECDNLFPDCVY